MGSGENLSRIIGKALSSDKIKTVDIVTNGTVIPQQVVFDAMRNPRLTLQISDYGKYSRKRNELKERCDKEGVKCVVRSETEKTWHDAGNLEIRGRNKAQIEKQLRQCGNICRSFHNGHLYYCPRQSFGTKLGIPDIENEYVDFTAEFDRKSLRQKIYELNQKRFLSSCNYCDEGTSVLRDCPVAEQMR